MQDIYIWCAHIGQLMHNTYVRKSGACASNWGRSFQVVHIPSEQRTSITHFHATSIEKFTLRHCPFHAHWPHTSIYQGHIFSLKS